MKVIQQIKGTFLKKAKSILFKEFFFHKCKLCIISNWFRAKIILILQNYLFWGYSKWQQIKQSTSS